MIEMVEGLSAYRATLDGNVKGTKVRTHMNFETVENGSTATYARVVRRADKVIRLAHVWVLKHGSNCGR
jgi:hypothetical protein